MTIAHDRADPATTAALRDFTGPVGLTLSGEAEQVMPASEVAAVLDFHSPTISAGNLFGVGDSGMIDLSGLSAEAPTTVAPVAAQLHRPKGPQFS